MSYPEQVMDFRSPETPPPPREVIQDPHQFLMRLGAEVRNTCSRGRSSDLWLMEIKLDPTSEATQLEAGQTINGIIPPEGIVGRIDGNTFGVIIPKTQEQPQRKQPRTLVIAAIALATLETLLAKLNHQSALRVSMGVNYYKRRDQDATQPLLIRTEANLKEAKEKPLSHIVISALPGQSVEPAQFGEDGIHHLTSKHTKPS